MAPAAGLRRSVHIPNLFMPRELRKYSINQKIDRKSLRKYHSIQSMNTEKTYTVIIEQDEDGMYTSDHKSFQFIVLAKY